MTGGSEDKLSYSRLTKRSVSLFYITLSGIDAIWWFSVGVTTLIGVNRCKCFESEL